MLNPDQFVARCIHCLASGGTANDIAALTRLALASQQEERAAWGKQEILHCADDLLIVDLTLPPFTTSPIHDHGTWAVIGVSEGCEVDQLLSERPGGLAGTSRHELRAGDTLVLPPDCIHFIANPWAQPARGIHVYGKNLMLTERRMWDPQTCRSQAMDLTLFEQWEQSLTRRSAATGSIVPPAIHTA